MLKALRNKKTKMAAVGDLKIERCGLLFVCGWCGSVEQVNACDLRQARLVSSRSP